VIELVSHIYFYYSAAWHECLDVLPDPPPTWQSGMASNDIMDLVAGTGIASFTLDNSPANAAKLAGYYSPGHVNCPAWFAEDLPVKITVQGVGPEKVLNGGFETAGAWTHVADLETGDMSQFNGGSGVVSTVAAKHGTYGMVSTMNVESMGRINTPNNTSQVADFWYHPNNFTGAISSLMIMTANVGGWAWFIYQDPTTHQIGSYVFDDTGTVIVAGSPLSVAWHHVRAIWKKSTAPGANDGYAKIYVDGELYTASTGIDNDVRVVDWTDFGMEGAIWGGTGTYWLDDVRVLENAVVPNEFAN
jgi:hypothetical protein